MAHTFTGPANDDPGSLSPTQDSVNFGAINDSERARLPEWVSVTDQQTLRPGSQSVNRASNSRFNSRNREGTDSVQERTLTVAAEDSIIPIVYGIDRIGGKIGPIVKDQSGKNTVLLVAWCIGEVEEITKIIDGNGDEIEFVSRTDYLGVDNQPVDPTLSSLISGYQDDLIITERGETTAICYSVLTVKPENLSNGFIAEIKGKKLYNPRDPFQSLTDKNTWTWSDNPSLAFADFSRSKLYGWGQEIDWDSVEENANKNDEGVLNIGRRRTINLSITRKTDIKNHISALRLYAGCFILRENGKIKLVPDRPASSSRTITDDDIIHDTLEIEVVRAEDSPTVVSVIYTNTTGDQWRDRRVRNKLNGVDTGEIPWREKTLRLDGINNKGQAERESIEELNYATLADQIIKFKSRSTSIVDQIGDVVEIKSDQLPNDSKEIRILEAYPETPGIYRISGRLYNDSIYSDRVEEDPDPINFDFSSPLNPPMVSGVVATEEVYQTENGTYRSRIRVSWDSLEDSYEFLGGYNIIVSEIGGKIIFNLSANGNQTETVTGSIEEDKKYQISVRAESIINNIFGKPSSVILESLGKGLIPSDVPRIMGFEAAGEVRLKWEAAVDIDIWRYEIRWGSTTGSWETAEVLDLIDGLRVVTREIPPSDAEASGQWRFYVKAIDSVKQESENAATVDLVVTEDERVFFVDSNEFSNPSITNMASFKLPGTFNITRYVTEVSGDTMETLFNNAGMGSASWTSQTEELATFHTSGDSTWESEEFDYGKELSGTFRATITAEELGGGSYSVDIGVRGITGSTIWYPGELAQATGRYAKIRIRTEGSETLKVTQPIIQIRLDVIARSDKGIVTFDASKHYVQLDGINGKGDVTGTTNHPSGDADHTVEGWFYIISLPSAGNRIAPLILKPLGADGHRFIITDSGFLQGGRAGDTVKTVKLLNPFQWYHLAAVYNSAIPSYKFYVMGEELVNTGDISGFNLSGGLEIGGDALEEFANINWHQVGLWNTVKTQQEIIDNMFSELTGTESGLVGLWHGNEGTGSTVADETSNSNDLSLSGGTFWKPRGKRVSIEKEFVKVKTLITSPVNTDQSRKAVPDNITVGKYPFFDAFLFDSSDARVNGDVSYIWEGI